MRGSPDGGTRRRGAETIASTLEDCSAAVDGRLRRPCEDGSAGGGAGLFAFGAGCH